MKRIIYTISLLFLFASCEDVIEIDLESEDPRLVIEGTINDIDETCTVKLSKTTDYFVPGIYPPVSNASVSVTDNNGIVSYFEETAPGIYTSENLKGVEQNSYRLDVQSEGENYTASVTMPQKVVIDSLTFEPAPFYMESDDGYIVNCYLSDPVEFRNYYRMKAYNINDSFNGNKTKWVFNDDFVNGNTIIMPWDLDDFEPQDTVVVELQTIDKPTYYYYYTLFPIIEGGFGGTNPANPKTNLDNNALGYFGTYTTSRDTIIILPN